jgi:hypothetical protein
LFPVKQFASQTQFTGKNKTCRDSLHKRQKADLQPTAHNKLIVIIHILNIVFWLWPNYCFYQVLIEPESTVSWLAGVPLGDAPIGAGHLQELTNGLKTPFGAPMTDKSSDIEHTPPVDGETTAQESASGVTFSRRRLIKIGVATVPVVLTLASRPVLAWHCKSPSAWGSEQINPNTSLATNGAHPTYVDETWTIANWKLNSDPNRAGLGRPWYRFDTKFTGSDTTYRNQTINYLKTTKSVPLALPTGVTLDQKVYKGLRDDLGWSTFAKYMIVAQLNRHLLAAGTWDPQCVTEQELTDMVNGVYPTATAPWSQDKIVSYLNNNWIVRTS